MILLDDYCYLLEKEREIIGDFPTYLDFDKWVEINIDTLEVLEEYEEIQSGVFRKKDVALKLWQEFQAFYIGLIFQGNDITPLLIFVRSCKNTIFRNIPKDYDFFIPDVSYVISEENAKKIVENLISIHYNFKSQRNEEKTSIPIISNVNEFNTIFGKIKKKIAIGKRKTHLYLSGEEAGVVVKIIGSFNSKILVPAINENKRDNRKQFKMFSIHLIDELENIDSFKQKSSLYQFGFDERAIVQIGDELHQSFRGDNG